VPATNEIMLAGVVSDHSSTVESQDEQDFQI